MPEITPANLMTATWDDIALLYRPLIDQVLQPDDPDGIERWLAQWSALDAALIEAANLAQFAVSGDSDNPDKESTHLRFASDIMPRHAEIVTSLAAKLLDTGYSRDDLETTLQRFRMRRRLFRVENIPLQQELGELSNRYNRICGQMTVTWRGATLPISQLTPYLQSPDRDTREQAWRMSLQPYLDRRDELADVFDRQLALRQQIARNAGFENYRDYAFADLYRFDYSPDDCMRFHHSVRRTFVPAATEIMEQRTAALGIDSLRPWDVDADPANRETLAPYETTDDLAERSRRIFARLDPALGEQFERLRNKRLLDLDSRAGKRPGGYCSPLPWQKLAVIFMSGTGTATDVLTLLHEAGHAFHEIAMADLPFVYQRHIGEEMCEVASMSMELIAWPWLHADQGGFYTSGDYDRARAEHLERVLTRFPWVAVVDAFQHWLYTDPAAADRDARDEMFVRMWGAFDRHTDWTGLDDLRRIRWYKQLHIFLSPFYYIEYGIAQLAALQVWKRSMHDPAGTLDDLRAAFALGGTRRLPELYARTGAEMVFNEAGMADLVRLVQQELGTAGMTI